MIKEDIEWLGPIPATDVEKALSKILKRLFSLEEKGEIVIIDGKIGDLMK